MRGGKWISCLVFVGLLLGGCVSQAKYLDLQKSYVERGKSLARANAIVDEHAEKLDLMAIDLRAKERLLEKREEELATIERVSTKVNQEWRSAITNRLGQLFQKDEGVTYDSERKALVLEGEVFFDSGSAKIKQKTKKTLQKVANILKSRPGGIQIVGHTDSDPVRKTASRWPLGNLQLSGARALNVLLFLKTEGKVPASRMTFAGAGATQPRVPNDSKAHKRQNRRVEIKVQDLSE